MIWNINLNFNEHSFFFELQKFKEMGFEIDTEEVIKKYELDNCEICHSLEHSIPKKMFVTFK